MHHTGIELCWIYYVSDQGISNRTILIETFFFSNMLIWVSQSTILDWNDTRIQRLNGAENSNRTILELRREAVTSANVYLSQSYHTGIKTSHKKELKARWTPIAQNGIGTEHPAFVADVLLQSHILIETKWRLSNISASYSIATYWNWTCNQRTVIPASTPNRTIRNERLTIYSFAIAVHSKSHHTGIETSQIERWLIPALQSHHTGIESHKGELTILP